jgi:hypothetical protein
MKPAEFGDREGWVTTYRGDNGTTIQVERSAILAGPHVNWKHIDGPLMTWAGEMHWFTMSERLGLFLRRTTVEAIATRRWPHLRRIWWELGTRSPNDIAYANLPESRRRAIILWEMFGRPMGVDGVRVLQQAVEQSTNEQVLETLRDLVRRR